MKKLNLVWLLIVPAIVLVFNFFFVKNQGVFYMNWTDPSYAYLLNGLNLANGTMEVGHIDHPGTTVQVVSALIIKITHVVSGKNADLATDVLSDPEKYLHILSFVFVLAICSVLFYLGVVVKRISNSIPAALFFQTGILVSFTSLTSMADIRPEPFLIFGGVFLVILCFRFIHEKEISPKRMYGYSLKFAVVCAFLVVTKMTSIPLIILPLFLIPKWKNWFLYGMGLVVFAILFLIPALPKMGILFNWIHNLFSHSGVYGAGEEKIIDVTTFKTNLWNTFIFDIPFLLTCLLMVFAALVLIFKGKLGLKAWKESVRVRLSAGILIVTTACVLMVAKQFKFHYLIPAYGLMMLGSFLALQLLFSAEKFRGIVTNAKLQLAGALLLVFSCSYSDLGHTYFYKNFENPKKETARVMSTYASVPHLYMTYEYYFAEVPPALYFGLCYSGDARFPYFEKLKKIYPNAYFYSLPEKVFQHWGAPFDISDLVSKNKQILVSYYYTDNGLIEESLTLLRKSNRGINNIEIKQVFQNPVSGEQLYELNCLGPVTGNSDSLSKIVCDAEVVQGGVLLSTDGIEHFQGAETIVQQEKHGGANSLGLNSTNPYGFGFDIDAQTQKHVEVTVWRKSASGKGALVATGDNGTFTQSVSTTIEKGENGWEKLKLVFEIPADYKDKTLRLFVWNENGNHVSYFDDLSIFQY